jgi:hypothetical protein
MGSVNGPGLDGVEAAAGAAATATAEPGAAVAAAAVDRTPATAQVRMLLERGGGNPDPAAIARIVKACPQARGEVIALLQQTVGNRFVQEMIATLQTGGEAGADAEARPTASGTLPPALRAKMEMAFATDFADVRIHEGGEAAAMGAVAYAHGNDLHFAPGAYDPTSEAGQALIGHELAHVVQQRNGRSRVQAKGADGAPLDTDAGLEAEADTMGARAARGESTGMSAPAQAASAPTIQRYRVAMAGPEPWRVSETGRALVRSDGGPAARSKDVWADPLLIGTANNALTAAGSFIRVAAGNDTRQVIVREGGNNVALPEEVFGKAREISSGDQPRDYYQALNTELERVPPTGVLDRAHQLSGGKTDSTHEEMQHHYYEGLRQRRDEARTTDQTRTLVRVVPSFDRATAPPGVGGVYDAIDDRQHGRDVDNARPTVSHPDLPEPPMGIACHGMAPTLLLPSDCNDAARVVMGVSTNDEQPMVGQGGVAPQQVAPQPVDIQKTGGRTAHHEQAGLTALATSLAAYVLVVGQRGLPQNQVQVLQAQALLVANNPAVGMRALRVLRDTAPAVYADFAAYAQIDARVDPEVGDALVTYRLENSLFDVSRNARLYQALVDALMASLHINDVAARNILHQAGIDDTSTHIQIGQRRAALVQQLTNLAQGVQQGQAIPGVAEAKGAIDGHNLWNKHWAGVVMKDGGDIITLENDASTEDRPNGLKIGEQRRVINDGWGFAMYGTRQDDQTFHKQMMGTGDFGDFASTMRYRRPPQQAVVQPVQGLQPLTPVQRDILIYVRDHGAFDRDAFSLQHQHALFAITKAVKSIEDRFHDQNLVTCAQQADVQGLLA